MSAARSGLETEVVSIMRRVRQRGREEARALTRRLERQRIGQSPEETETVERPRRTTNGARLATPPAG